MKSGARAHEIILFLLCWLALCAVALRPSIRGNDGVGNYVYLVSLMRDGDLDFTNDYAAFDAAKQYSFKFAELPASPVTGRPSNRYGVGAAIFWSPFVLATHFVLCGLRPALADGIARPYEWAVGVGTAFWGGLALLMLFVRLRRDFGFWISAATIAALVMATPLGFYLLAHGSMSHGVEFFAATCALLAVERYWREPRFLNALWLGMAAGLLALTRAQAATWCVLLGAVAALRPSLQLQSPDLAPEGVMEPASAPTPPRRVRFAFSFRSIAFALAFILAAALVFLPQCWVWKELYGDWLAGPQPYMNGAAGEFSSWPRHAFAALFSERGGALAWHPVLALALVWLALAIRRKTFPAFIAWFALAGFLAQLWLVGCWSMWWGGASFGNRFFISSLPWLALGIAMWLGNFTPRIRWLRAGALALLILWNAGLLVQYALEMIPREESAPWSQVIRQNFTDVPKVILERRLRLETEDKPQMDTDKHR